MQDWFSKYFLYFYPLFFIGISILAPYWVALIGGWRLLARRFRLQGPFLGQKWRMQSASMRWLANYNGALTVGADTTGLFMVPFILFRAWHPALFVPWTEITTTAKTQLYFFKMVELRLGRSEQIPFRIKATLAAKIEAAAGTAWPHGYARAAEQPPSPIG